MMASYDAAGLQHDAAPAGKDSRTTASSPYPPATHRPEVCLHSPSCATRQDSKKKNTTTASTTITGSTLLRSMTRSRRRSGDCERAMFSLAGGKMMSAEEYMALPRSVQYVMRLFLLFYPSSSILEPVLPPAHARHVRCCVCFLRRLA
jgi:hypothetical protein